MKIQLCIIFALILTGCATVEVEQSSYNVAVDALASSDAIKKKNYLLMPGNADVTLDDLQFQEFSAYLVRVLSAQGYVPAESAQNADIVITLSYGIGDPVTNEYSAYIPLWGKTGVSSINTSGTATAYGSSASVNTTTTYTPEYGITGFSTYTGTATTFFRYAIITAYDVDKYIETEKLVKLWQSTITSTGSSDDLRLIFPVLIAASAPYIATNSGQKINLSLKETDKVVKAVRGLPVE